MSPLLTPSVLLQTSMIPSNLLLNILSAILTIQFTSAVDFLFNGFNTSDVSLYGNATVDSGILTLTKDDAFALGRALYPSKIPAKQPNTSLVLPFSSSFIFAMAPYAGRLPGHGIVFLFAPRQGIQYTSATQHLGFLNLTNGGDPNNHLFGVEFDVFANQEFADINDNHVGVDVNSLRSVNSHDAGYWLDDDNSSFTSLRLNNGRNYQVWIDFADTTLNVTMAPVGMRRPRNPLMSVPLNLSQVFEDEMFVGFSASTGDLIQSQKILAWSFSNTNFSMSEGLITEGLPSFELQTTPFHRSKGFIAGTTAGVLSFAVICCIVAYVFVKRSERRIAREREEMEDWELEYWPHRLSYQEIDSSTKSFAQENVIGIGGNGKVYRGVFPGGSEVAVKRISHENAEGIRAFLAEISTLGRVKHRNLVGLRGWCKQDKSSLFLVYDYMENGSLDKRIFDSKTTLRCEDRIRILKQVASGVLYLHEGWESKILHRDIKASNVLLDMEMNARLGDFGLARMHDHDKAAGTTRVVGTVGYLAPEIVKTGRASTQTDVFSYGVLILEVMCGRRPIEEGKPPLLDWVREAVRRGELVSVMDERVRGNEEAERVVQLGLVCAHQDANVRPTMRQVVKFFEGEGMDGYLVEQMRNRDVLSMDHQIWSSHPTFFDVTQGISASMSLSWSNSLLDGIGR